MAVSARKVQNKRDANGVLTGKPGTVYDVNIKYNSPEGKKTYSKKGFATKKEATQHEAEMKVKLSNPVYTPVVASQGKQTVKEYLEEWVENHGNIDLEKMQFGVVEQMPFKVPPGTKLITEMAPTKSNDRILPITEETLPYFLRQFDLIERQRELIAASGGEYYDNKLFIAKPDGSPQRRDRMSANFGQLIRHLEMPHIRFHDLRHTAATNMHQLTGDFYTVGEILGHTLKGIGMSLGISTNLEAVTAQYVDVRLERKKAVLETYHKALHPQKDAPEKDATSKDTPKKAKKRSSGMEL